MKSEFVGLVLLALILSLALLTLGMAVLLAPVLGGVYGIYLYLNRPAAKERKEIARTQALYEEAISHRAPGTEDAIALLRETFPDDTTFRVACALYEEEDFASPPPPPSVSASALERARYRDRLNAYATYAQAGSKDLKEFVRLLQFLLPKREVSRAGVFPATVSMTGAEVDDLVIGFFMKPASRYFSKLRAQLDQNLADQKQVPPRDYDGPDPGTLYLKKTPLLPLAERETQLELVDRTHHTHIVAGSGWGKTTLLEYLIKHDLTHEDCCIIVIDNQRQIIPRLAKLDWPKVAYISPQHSLGINLFDVRYQELRKLRDGEQVISASVELLEYVLGSILDAEFTPKQRLVFQFAIQLCIAIPGATIHTFMDILEAKNLKGYQQVIDTLPPMVQRFLNTEFCEPQFTKTKIEEINWRVWAMLKNPTFARIFSAPSNPIKMMDQMAKSNLVLIDTDINLLSEKGSSLFGRLFIAQILQAARRRFEGQHRRVYLYIDEAPIYFDQNLATMLQQARKANIGVILAHQDLDQARDRNILSPIMGNTATKFAGGLSDADAKTMAANMNTSAEFIKGQKKRSFAAYVGGQTYSVTADLDTVDLFNTRDVSALQRQMEELYGYEPNEPIVTPQPSAAEVVTSEPEPTRHTESPKKGSPDPTEW